MKTVILYTGDTFNSKQVFTEILSMPANGCSIGDMRKRMKVLDRVEAATFEIELEDADFELLKSSFNGNQFRYVHKDLIAIADTLDG